MSNEQRPPMERTKVDVDDMKVRGVEALRSASKGWKQMIGGNKESRQERIIKEHQQKVETVKSGKPLTEENNYRPGDEDVYSEEPPSTRQLKESYKQTIVEKKMFNGTADQVVMKLSILFEKDAKTQLLGIEESGFNTYKITYSTKA